MVKSFVIEGSYNIFRLFDVLQKKILEDNRYL